MEPNNFEKTVQQKMEELKIPPSEAVWNHVEKRIGKRKHKRIIFILFFIFLFFLSGGFWLYNSVKNNAQQKNHPLSNLLEKNNDSPKRLLNKQDSNLGRFMDSLQIISETPDTSRITDTKIKTVSTKIQNAAIRGAANKQETIFRLSESIKEDKAISLSQIDKLKGIKNIAEEENKLSDQNNQHRKEAAVTEVKQENNLPDLKVISQKKLSRDTLFKIEKFTAKKDSFPVKPSQNLQMHQWIFGVTFSGGKSFLSNHLLNTDKNSSDFSSAPSSGIGNSGGGSSSVLPPKMTNSAAFTGGFFIEKNISLKTKISLGINYKYFSTINKTGNEIDSVQTAFTSTTYVNTYRNNFHYMELPVSLKFQLTNNNLLPVYWLVGINISELINTNALQFKNDRGVYYNDNSLFNKTQLGFNTGFFATLFSHKNTLINIGPYFSFSATKMANNGFYDKKHFHFIGISAEILFNKK
jgi:hypothetical protein